MQIRSKFVTSIITLSLVLLGTSGRPAQAASSPVDCTDTANTSILFVVEGTDFVGTTANEIICGTAGDDVIDGGGGNDIIYGLDGNDQITSGSGNDEIDGGAGDDTIKSGAGNDLIRAGDGDDDIDAGAGNDEVFAEAGDDNVDGEEGNDEITLGDGDDYAEGGAGADKLWGGDGSDSLIGEAGNDWVDAGAGDDTIKLDAGDDYAQGGPGADLLFGGNGKDALNAGTGSDSLDGGAGADSVNGGTQEGNDKDYCAKDKLDTQQNCFYDSKGPSIVSVAVTDGARVDTSLEGKIITVRARIKDSGSGVANISLGFSRLTKDGILMGNSVSMWFSPWSWGCDPAHPGVLNTNQGMNSIGCRIAGDENDGIYEFRAVVTKYTMPGTYVLTNINLSDAAGNSTNLWGDQIKAKKLAVNFKQIGGGDGAPPVLKSVSILTKTVNTSAESQIISLRVAVADGFSGVRSVNLNFSRLTKSNTGWQNVNFGFWDSSNNNGANSVDCVNGHAQDPANNNSMVAMSSCRVSGNSKNQVIEMKLRLPAYSPAGTYQLNNVNLSDFAGNDGWLGEDKLKAKKFAVNFKQVGPGDSAGPMVKSISMLTPMVDSGATAQIVTLKVRVKDNSSGVSGFSLGFGRLRTGLTQPDWSNVQAYWSPMYTWDSNTHSQVLIEQGNCNADKTHAVDPTIQSGWSSGTACRISGTNKDGVYEVKLVVPAHAAAGNYRIYNFNATDKANNSSYMMYQDIVKRKLNVGFKNG